MWEWTQTQTFILTGWDYSYFFFFFSSFYHFQLKAYMLLYLKLKANKWKIQTNPTDYGGTLSSAEDGVIFSFSFLVFSKYELIYLSKWWKWMNKCADLVHQLQWFFLQASLQQSQLFSPSSWMCGWVWSRYLPEGRGRRTHHFNGRSNCAPVMVEQTQTSDRNIPYAPSSFS